MTDLERKLKEEKMRLDEITAPGELEGRLRAALDKVPKQKKHRMPRWIPVAAALLILSLAGYQYNAFAYYGKQLLGFEEIMPDTLTKLNQAGNGQNVDKEMMLPDGSKFTIEGILADENRFVLYYTIDHSEGVKDDLDFMQLNGFLTNSYSIHGTSIINDDGTQLKGMRTFEPVSPFAKKLTLELHDANSQEPLEITFPYNPDAALETRLKQSIKKSVQVDQGNIRFDSITATPSQTTIKGKIKVDNYDRISLGFEGVKLLVDGVQMDSVGSGVSSAFNGDTFTIDYDALPDQLDSLALEIDTFVGYKQVNETIPLTAGEESVADLDGYEAIIRQAEVTSDGLEVTVATEENILLDAVTVQVGNEKIPLTTTLSQDYVIGENDKEYKERTLFFNTRKFPETMRIKGIHYEKEYGETINITIKK
ncbi:DUF4179 domain-containing protein [Sporosarcina cascadiensis]|uniref:DUF4179 domain-containing protein n=1 Tax=Sporosarcina cascadiensis TaxID=2660747 RepID=UPI00129AFD86|nr:DUF4179 domain-containing protein [Sporosarcina cascadiensis]